MLEASFFVLLSACIINLSDFFFLIWSSCVDEWNEISQYDQICKAISSDGEMLAMNIKHAFLWSSLLVLQSNLQILFAYLWMFKNVLVSVSLNEW